MHTLADDPAVTKEEVLQAALLKQHLEGGDGLVSTAKLDLVEQFHALVVVKGGRTAERRDGKRWWYDDEPN